MKEIEIIFKQSIDNLLKILSKVGHHNLLLTTQKYYYIMKIITNNHYRPVLYWHDLTTKEQAELKDSYDDVEESTFFRYRGQVYDLNNFMRSTDNRFGDWQGYHCDSFFSAVLVKYDDSCEAVKVGLALS